MFVHRPLIFAFRQKLEKASPRRVRQLDYIGQLTTDIRQIPGNENITAALLSCIQTCNTTTYLVKMAVAQLNNNKLKSLLTNAGNQSISLDLK